MGCGIGGCVAYAATSSGTFQDDAGTMTFTLGKSRQAKMNITDIVVTAYSIMAFSVSDAECIGIIGVPLTLPDPYTLTRPTNIRSSDVSDFQTYITDQLQTSLGVMGCAQNMVTSPTSLPATASSTTSLIPAPSASLPDIANSTTSPTPHSSSTTRPIVSSRLDERAKIGMDIAAFFALLILILSVAFIWHRRRLRSAAITAKKQGEAENKQEGASTSEGNNQPYLQQKAELEAEERQRHELEAQQKIYELDGETGVNEIPAGTYEHRLAVMRSRQELTGGEHCQELDPDAIMPG